MPEMWLPYGSVDVPIDIRGENIARVFDPRITTLEDVEMLQKIREVSLDNDSQIVMCDSTSASRKALGILLDSKDKDVSGVKVVSHKQHYTPVKKICESRGFPTTVLDDSSDILGEFDGVQIKLPSMFNKRRNIILISKVGYDPLFGFSGGSASLVRSFDQLLAEAFYRRNSDKPSSGYETDSGKFADGLVDILDGVKAIEVVGTINDVVDIYTGNVLTSHRQAKEKLTSISKETLSGTIRNIIVSPGGSEIDSTLSSSLSAIWNVLECMKEGSNVILIAECSEGLGSEAFRRYICGRLDIRKLIKKRDYVRGVEVLLYLQEILGKINITVTSSLPHYYVESILGLHVASRSQDALTHIFSTSGPRAKVHIVPYASQTILRNGEE